MVLLLPVLAVVGTAPWWLRALPPRGSPAKRRGAWARRRARAEPSPVDAAVLLDLGEAALRAGVSVPAALRALGEAVGGDTGAALGRAGVLLLLGAGWAEAWTGAPPTVRPLAEALEPAWQDGVDPTVLLAGAARSLRANRDRAAREAAARLGARLVLPLGLCFLPAFVLLGLAPVLLSTGLDLLGR